MLPTNREEFIQYCFRRLGHPVIEINVDGDQVEDRVDEAILQMQTFHGEGSEKWYISYQITAADMANNYLTMPNDIIGITRLFTIASSQTNSAGNGGFNMFDINYQIRLNELYDYTAGDYVYFELANEHLRMLEMLFTGEIPIRFNRYNHILYIDGIWGTRFKTGDFIMLEGFRQLDISAGFWADPWLLRAGTCLLKLQWGNNLSKFNSVTLPGGMILNGQKIKDEAEAEWEMLKKELRDQYESPPEWIFG